ncbi:MAG TPA: hypothetical protein VIO61_10495 [Anaerolineaceae bacterium]
MLEIIFVWSCLFASAGYLWFSAETFRSGFPLDDAWIHQVYARNLVERFEWSFIPGIPSGGSTSPLWSALLSLGYLLGLSPLIWAWTLGIICFIGTGLLGWGWVTRLIPKKGFFLWIILAVLAGEWHLIWAAVSGMETCLFMFWVLMVFVLLMKTSIPWGWIGILVGTAIWIRPDGITLLGPVILIGVIQLVRKNESVKSIGKMSLGCIGFAGLYLVFNYLTHGSWLPNTFFAKQAEYAILAQSPLLARLITQLQQPVIGVGILLFPGFLYCLYTSIRGQKWRILAIIIWIIGYAGLFAFRLPVVYQHGRYIMPVIPPLLIFGLAGSASISDKLRDSFWERVLKRGWTSATLMVILSFYLLGANAYAQDVAIIESEMVTTAKWVNQNLEKDALLAAHDIGALGYFSNRNLIDLAGLVSPEVIPYLRDEDELNRYLMLAGVDYLVTFPGWYPKLVQGKYLVYKTNAIFAPRQGGENMGIYRWQQDP